MDKVVNLFFCIGLFANAMIFIPQAIKIFKLKSAKNISLLTFGGMNAIQLSMIFHGYLIRDYLLTFGVLLAFFTCGMVTCLSVLYKNR